MASVKSKPNCESLSVRANVKAWEFLAFCFVLSRFCHLTSSAIRKLSLNKYTQCKVHQALQEENSKCLSETT